ERGPTRDSARAQSRPRDGPEYQAESALRISLQRDRDSNRRRRALSVCRLAAEPDDCQRCDELQFGLGNRQCAALALAKAVVPLVTPLKGVLCVAREGSFFKVHEKFAAVALVCS